MYLSFYKLKSKPFPEKTDLARLWLNKQTKKALTLFRDGIMENRGVMLLTGEVGAGKTSFINILVSSLPENVVVGNIVNPGLDPQGLLHVIADIFRLPDEAAGQEALLSSFKQFLIGAAADDKKVLLIIDEAQQLSDALLQLILHLADLNDNGSTRLNIILVGQNDFSTLLAKPEHDDLQQRIAITHKIVPLTKAETAQYIKHNLRIASGSEDIFSPEAVDAVYTITGGTPRLINLICDLALLSGFTTETPVISREIVSGCRTKLMLPHDKSVELQPVAVSKTEKVDKQPSGRPRKKGWGRRGVGLLILIVLILFGARELVKRMEVPDDTEISATRPPQQETTTAQEGANPPSSQTGREVVITQLPERNADQSLMEQTAVEVPPEAATVPDGAEQTTKKIAITAGAETPPVIHDQPQTVEQAKVAAPTPSEETPTTIPIQSSAQPQDKAIRITASAETPPAIHDQPQTVEQAKMPAKESQSPTGVPTAIRPAQHSAPPAEKKIEIAAATPAQNGDGQRAAKTSPDSPVIRQEKPLPEKMKAQENISVDSDLRNSEKKVITVFFGNLRDGPSIEANIIGVAKQGDIVTDLLKKESWHFVKLEDGKLGWMHRSLFAPTQEIAIEKIGEPEPAAPSAVTLSTPTHPATPSQTAHETRVTVQPLAEQRAQPQKQETPVAVVEETAPPQTPPPPEPAVSEPVAPATPPATERPIVKTGNPEALEWTQKSFESVSQGHYSQAIDEATKAIGLDPGLVNPYINRAWAYCETGLYEKAIADCRTALTIEPENALAFNNLGLAYHRMAQLAMAREYYKKACDLKLDVACSNYQLLLSAK